MTDRSAAAGAGGQPRQPVFWDQLTWPDVAALVARMRAVIIPIGAVEQHGPHLPLNTDWLLVSAVAERVSARTGVPVVPPLPYGTSASHGGWPGTLSLRPHTLAAVLEDVARWLYMAGVRQFFLLNGHEWNTAGMQTVVEGLRCGYSDVQVKLLNWWEPVAHEPEMSLDCPAAARLAHGNLTETALMLYVRPDLVHLDRAAAEDDEDFFWDYRMDQISRTGVMGRDAAGATVEVGRKLIELASDRLAERLRAGLSETFRYKTDWTLER